MPFTCPRCSRTSQHPQDARQGYCAACRDWTGPWLVEVHDLGGCEVRVVTDPGVPPGSVMLSYARGAWQFFGADDAELLRFVRGGTVDLRSVQAYIAETYGPPGYTLADFARLAATAGTPEELPRFSEDDCRRRGEEILRQAVADCPPPAADNEVPARREEPDLTDHGGILWDDPMEWSPGDPEL